MSFNNPKPWDEDEDEREEWLASYSDLITDLLAVFVLLFSFSTLTTAVARADDKKDGPIATESQLVDTSYHRDNSDTSWTTSYNTSYTSDVSYSGEPSEYDLIYEYIKNKIKESGYSDSITIEKGKQYIIFRFTDNVLFHPDSPQMKSSSHDIITYIGATLNTIEDKIKFIEIGGHTALVLIHTNPIDPWVLSCERAVTVLKFFRDECKLPESKMVAMGFSHYQPLYPNDTEANKAKNRRVEVKITYVNAP